MYVQATCLKYIHTYIHSDIHTLFFHMLQLTVDIAVIAGQQIIKNWLQCLSSFLAVNHRLQITKSQDEWWRNIIIVIKFVSLGMSFNEPKMLRPISLIQIKITIYFTFIIERRVFKKGWRLKQHLPIMKHSLSLKYVMLKKKRIKADALFTKTDMNNEWNVDFLWDSYLSIQQAYSSEHFCSRSISESCFFLYSVRIHSRFSFNAQRILKSHPGD